PRRRVPRRALPRGARRARRRVLHAGRVEGGSPAVLVAARELKVVALMRHPDRDPADAGPGAEPRPKRVQRAVVREHRAPGEAERRYEESAALVQHGATGSPDPPAVGTSAELSGD